MIVVALIGVLVALAVPSYMRVRKESQARRVMNDVRIIDSAIDTWASEFNMTDGSTIDLPAASHYTKAGQLQTNDILGNPYFFGVVGTNQIRVADSTKTAFR